MKGGYVRKIELMLANVLTFVIAIILVTSTSQAGELGKSRSAQPSKSRSAGRPAVVASASSQSRASVSRTLRQNNTGADSVYEVGRLVTQAATTQQTQNAQRNLLRTNRNRNTNITNLSGCKKITTGDTSCYGRDDAFALSNNKLGFHNKDSDMCVAFNSFQLLGEIIVIRNPQTNVARTATVTDTGRFGKKYGRVADLCPATVEAFGLRCTKNSGSMQSIEIYACPGK